MSRNIDIAIIGAGIGGLTAAVALTQKGYNVHVYERAGTLGEVGAGLQMGPNAVKVVDALGMGDKFRAFASEPTERLSLQWDTGALRAQESFQGRMKQLHGAPYFMAHRADLHALLVSGVPAANLHLNMQCTGIRQTSAPAIATFADGTEVEANVIVGADGIHSQVRKSIFGEQKPRYTGQVCWRLVLPMDALKKAEHLLPRPLTGMEYVGWLGPNGHVLFYPLRGDGLLNIFAGFVSPEWADESWTVPSTKKEMLEAYTGWNPGMLAVMEQADEAFRWGIHDRDPLPTWTQGRVTLLGDSAHPMMPTLAQGGAASMEDGLVFANCIAAQPGDLDAALKAYEEERRPRTAQVQDQARRQFVNNQKVPAPPPLPVDWIYSYDATTAGAAASQETDS